MIGQPELKGAQSPRSGDRARTDFPVTQNGLLATGKTHIARHNKLRTTATGTASNRCDADDGRLCQAYRDVMQWKWEPRWPRFQRNLFRTHQVIVGDEVVLISTVKDHDFDIVIRFKLVEKPLHTHDHVNILQIDRRVIKGDTPIAWGTLRDAYW